MAECVQCGTPFTPASRGRRPRYCSRSCQARAYRARARARDPHAAPPAAPEPSHQRGAGAPREEPARPDGGLTAERIVATAVRLADTHGLDGLAMRHVAAELGVATMSLYHHVRGKEELVELMVEAVFRESADLVHHDGDPPVGGGSRPGGGGTSPAGGEDVSRTSPEARARHDHDHRRGTWRAELEAWARREWELLSRHPWVLRVVTSFPPVLAPGLLADVERVMAALVDAGLDPLTAHQAFQSASGLAEGLALLRAGTAEAERRGLTGRWRTVEIPALLGRLGAENYPTQSVLVDSMDAAMDVDQMFEFGLARLLDGIALFVTGGGGGAAAARPAAG